MQTGQLHDGRYLWIFWDAKKTIIGIESKETTAPMASEEFKVDRMLFASHNRSAEGAGHLGRRSQIPSQNGTPSAGMEYQLRRLGLTLVDAVLN